MKSLFRVVRYSGVGVFFAGILSVLAGCTEREGILGLLLLILLQFCSGPMEMEETGTGPLAGMQFTDFTSATPDIIGPITCTSPGGGGGGGTPIVTAFIPNLDERGLGFSGNVTGGPGSITIAVDNGKLTISTTDTCNTTSIYINFSDSSDTNSVDFSAFSQVHLRVASITGGPVTGCEIIVTDDVAGPGITSAPFDLSVGDTSVSIAGGINMNAMNRIGFGFCDFNGPTTIVIESFHIE